MTPKVPPPGEHGGDAPAVAAALGVDVRELLDLSQTLNPFAPDVAPVVGRHLDQLGRYPDPTRAAGALADHLSVGVDRLVLTNGGSEAIALVAAELGSGRVDEPDFALYRRHLPRLDPHGPRFRSNPHNPTGRLAGPDDRAAVWDEAFFPLSTGVWTRGDADRGSIVVGSLTKLLACPGLRVGYVLAPDPAVAGRLRRRQPMWSVNGLAAAALPELLATVDLVEWSGAVAAARGDLIALLVERGLDPQPSDAPWVLVDAPGLRERLAPHGVLVRDGTSFGLPGAARIAVPHPDHLGRLARALDAALPSGRPASPPSRPPHRSPGPPPPGAPPS